MTKNCAIALIKSFSHLGGMSCSKPMEKYVYGRRTNDKIHIFDINKTWEKLIMAASLIVTLPTDSIFVVSTKNYGRKAVLKFSELIGCVPITGRFIPGSFSNKRITGKKEPRLVITSDPFADKQVILEAGCVNTPSISFVNTDNELRFIDVAIPMNNRSPESIASGFAILANIIRYMKGEIKSVDENLRDTIESFLYRDPDTLDEILNEIKESQDDEIDNSNQEILVGEE